MNAIFRSNEVLPVVDVGTIAEIDVDGILQDGVTILGTDFQTTFYRIVKPFGFLSPVKAPVLRIRRPILSYQPNQLHGLLQAEHRRLTQEAGLMVSH